MGTRCHSQVSFPVWFSYPCLTSAYRFPRRAPATCGHPFLPILLWLLTSLSSISFPSWKKFPGAHGNKIEGSHAELTDGGVHILNINIYFLTKWLLTPFHICASLKLSKIHFQLCSQLLAANGNMRILQYFLSCIRAFSLYLSFPLTLELYW